MTRTHYIPSRKPAAAKESHQSIQKQTQDFIAGGGKIEVVDLGMTGQIGISTEDYTIVQESHHKQNTMIPAAVKPKVHRNSKKKFH